MFPTRVGMNLMVVHCALKLDNVPHSCGDEPGIDEEKLVELTMFPTRVGMNRSVIFVR